MGDNFVLKDNEGWDGLMTIDGQVIDIYAAIEGINARNRELVVSIVADGKVIPQWKITGMGEAEAYMASNAIRGVVESEGWPEIIYETEALDE